MEVKGRFEMTMKSDGVTELHYRSETFESYIEVKGKIVRETSPTIQAYRAFVVGLVQTLREERTKFFGILKEMDSRDE
jgi:hypothetical protein